MFGHRYRIGAPDRRFACLETAAVDARIAVQDAHCRRRRGVPAGQTARQPLGEDRAGARCAPFGASVSPARTPEPDVRVPTHPALHEPVSLDYATVASALVHGVGICPPR
jgi:hypothetical protein